MLKHVLIFLLVSVCYHAKYQIAPNFLVIISLYSKFPREVHEDDEPFTWVFGLDLHFIRGFLPETKDKGRSIIQPITDDFVCLQRFYDTI